jgi:signal transduction histidine kinase
MEHDGRVAAGGRQSADTEEVARLAVAGELVGAITHDLRQPLTAMGMNVSAAIRLLSLTPPRLRDAIDALGDVLVQQRRMGEALRVLEDLSHRREPDWHAFDVVALVREVISLVRSDALARHVALELTVRGVVPPIIGDVTLVRHALLNVALTALEATSMSGRDVAAVSVTVHHAGEFAEVIIRHPGTHQDTSDGQGSALALARSVIDAHAATIVVKNEPGADATVIMRWPLRRSDSH